MERLNRNVSPFQSALQETPEVLQSVRVNISTNVLNSVVNDLVRVVRGQPFIREQEVSVQSGASLNMLSDFSLKGGLPAIRDNHSADFAATLKDAHDGGFITSASSSDAPLSGALVHESGLTADKGFIYFDVPGQFSEVTTLHSQAEPLQHEPSRLLGDAKSAVNLHAANAVLAVDDHPKGHHPLIQSKRRVLKDGSNLERELLLAFVAEPDAARFDKRVPILAATWASHLAGRPAQLNGILEGPLWVGEVNNGLLKSFRCFHA